MIKILYKIFCTKEYAREIISLWLFIMLITEEWNQSRAREMASDTCYAFVELSLATGTRLQLRRLNGAKW